MILGSGSKNNLNPSNENISNLQIETNRLKRYGVAKAVIKELYRIDGGLKVNNLISLHMI